MFFGVVLSTLVVFGGVEEVSDNGIYAKDFDKPVWNWVDYHVEGEYYSGEDGAIFASDGSAVYLLGGGCCGYYPQQLYVFNFTKQADSGKLHLHQVTVSRLYGLVRVSNYINTRSKSMVWNTIQYYQYVIIWRLCYTGTI
jgi:hypothetical protein